MHGISEFEVKVFRSGTAAVVSVRGEIDLATAGDVRAAVVEHAGAERMVLDLTHVTFMDSSAIHLLDEALRMIPALTFRVPSSPAGLQVLVMTGMLGRLPLEPS